MTIGEFKHNATKVKLHKKRESKACESLRNRSLVNLNDCSAN